MVDVPRGKPTRRYVGSPDKFIEIGQHVVDGTAVRVRPCDYSRLHLLTAS